jgi:hypothetical protein
LWENRERFDVPLACRKYNETMGGVDQFDQRRCTQYGIEMHGRQDKWTLRVADALFDIAMTNSHVTWQNLYKNNDKGYSHFEFLAFVHDGLIKTGRAGRELRPQLSGVARNPDKHRYVSMFRVNEDGTRVPHQKKCQMCPQSRVKNEFRTSKGCMECQVWLCKAHVVA